MSCPAKVFDDEQSALKAILDGGIEAGDVMVLRYLGPKGGPGMPEMLAPTGALVGAGLGDSVGLITDGRFSGGPWGMVDRKRVVSGKSVSVRVDLGCRRIIKQKNKTS